jgi:hypothetical protein
MRTIAVVRAFVDLVLQERSRTTVKPAHDVREEPANSRATFSATEYHWLRKFGVVGGVAECATVANGRWAEARHTGQFAFAKCTLGTVVLIDQAKQLPENCLGVIRIYRIHVGALPSAYRGGEPRMRYGTGNIDVEIWTSTSSRGLEVTKPA